MSNDPIKMDCVRYNAATQSFEATVTVFGELGTRSYACAISAPITMTFADAADGLARQAQRRYDGRGGLFARPISRYPALRSGARRFNPRQWLREVIGKTGQTAA